MPSAKEDFISRIRCLNISIGSASVTNRSLIDVEHNSVARMLRNGLAVVSFAALEDFIKKRASEAMNEISRCSLPFTSLPEKLQSAATYEAISALNYQLSLRIKEDKIPYIQEHAAKIASTGTSSFELSTHTFAYNQANVNQQTIGTILKSFNVEDPWKQMTEISSKLGLTALPLVESYKNAARRRHKAAHVASADTPQTDISQFVKESFAIAISFDSLLSNAIKKLNTNDQDYIEGRTKIRSIDIKFRTIKYVDNRWKEYSENSNRAYRTATDLSTLISSTKNRASSLGQFYVEFDEEGIINDCVSF